MWAKDWLHRRKFSHTNLLEELRLYPKDWKNYLTMDFDTYGELLKMALTIRELHNYTNHKDFSTNTKAKTMFEAHGLPEDCPKAFYLKTHFPLCIEKLDTDNHYAITTYSQATAGPNGCVSIRTKVDYFLMNKEHKENVGTPLMSDTMSFPPEFVDELFVNPLEKIQDPAVIKTKSEMGIQASTSRKTSKKVKKKARSKSRTSKYSKCCCDDPLALPGSSRSQSDTEGDELMHTESISSICCCH